MSCIRSTPASRTTNGEIVTGPCTLTALGVFSVGQSGSAIFRDGGSSGPLVWALGTTSSDPNSQSISFKSPLRVKKSLYVTLTGSGTVAFAAIENPAPNQVDPL